MERLRFLEPREVQLLAARFGTPLFVYDLGTIKSAYEYFRSMPNEYGLTVRYSVKANPNRTILRLFDRLGAAFDASSVWEASRVIKAGVDGHRILFTGQEASEGWIELSARGMEFDAGSLQQLTCFGRHYRGSKVSIRVNPGFGSGLVKKLTTGGKHSSFGIWHELLEEALNIAETYGLTICRLHFHIGSGHEGAVLEQTVDKAIDICRKIPSVEILNLGGGYRVSALSIDPEYDHHLLALRIASRLAEFANETGRKLRLELEPGTYLVALAGSLITRVIDKVHTGASGHQLIKIDSGLTELIRPSYYGASHPLVTVTRDGRNRAESEMYMVSGHCCIAGDCFTPVPGNSEEFAPQELSTAEVGDFLVVERSGAYAASMSLKNFNSYPEAPEVLRLGPDDYALIRQRQTLEQITQNEQDYGIA